MPTPAWGPSSDLYFRTLSSPGRLNGMVLLDSLAVADDAQSADMMERAARRKDQPWHDEAMVGQTESKRFPFDFTAQLRSVTVPTLIVVGDDDFICSREIARRVHPALSNSKLLLIERSGHFPWMEQPAVFEKRVPEFLMALGLPAK